MEKEITYRHNIMNINSLDTFLSIKGGFLKGRRDVYFVRALGCGPDTEAKILAIDERMGYKTQDEMPFYRRLKSLPPLTPQEDMEFYGGQFEAWKAGGKLSVRNRKKDELFGSVLGAACLETAERYRVLRKNMTGSIEKNFVVKLLYWTDHVLGGYLADWNERQCFKILAEDVQKEQEYLFYYMLTLIGCDVLLFQSRADIRTSDVIKDLSLELKLGGFCELSFPEYTPCESKKITEAEPEEKPVSKIQVEQVRKPELKPVLKTGPQVRMPERQRQERRREDGGEKSFEELALLASSIVMIEVHDQRGKPIGTGSGVMIGKDGFILTNHHVTKGGYSFSVRIEDDSAVYRTNEIIKYNSVFDLSVIRIGKVLSPLPVYRGTKKLVRGQKVVAIGSPLGLFNSVSDGIISGFREIDTVDMIQFTAPISHGSSGGAVLNMQGEIIGISTAGFDGGQNINLAVGYETINMFVRGFC